MSLENRKLFIDIKNRFAYNNTRRKACFSSGLTLKNLTVDSFEKEDYFWLSNLKNLRVVYDS